MEPGNKEDMIEVVADNTCNYMPLNCSLLLFSVIVIHLNVLGDCNLYSYVLLPKKYTQICA